MKHLLIRHDVPSGASRWLSRSLLLAVALVPSVGASRAVYGQAATQDLADANLSAAELQQETLNWLDKYMSDSDLMRPSEFARIRAAVAQMSPTQLERWLTQTRKLREYVESPQWQVTKKWLRSFLKVQAIYTDEELQKFRQRLFDADPDQMVEMLQQIQAKHESMVSLHQASQQMRQMDLQARNASVARQDAANSAARATAARNVPLFGNAGNAGGTVRKPDSGYRVPGPLVDSMTMARWTVWRGAW